jgi:hypothetical protein
VVRSACAALSTGSEDVVECNWPQAFAANGRSACSAGTDRSLIRPWVGICPRRCRCRGWPRARAANAVLAANEVHRCGDRSRVNIRAHKDMQSEYAPQTVAHGRERRDRSTP